MVGRVEESQVYIRPIPFPRVSRISPPPTLQLHNIGPRAPILLLAQPTTDIPFLTPFTIQVPLPTNLPIMASGQPFASRSYAGTKLPDRSANANAMPFSASSFSRHRPMGASAPVDYPGVEGPKPPQQSSGPPAATQSHGPAQDANPLNRLTEEQREEINEAVSILFASINLRYIPPSLPDIDQRKSQSQYKWAQLSREEVTKGQTANDQIFAPKNSSRSSISIAIVILTTTSSASLSAPLASLSQNKNSFPSSQHTACHDLKSNNNRTMPTPKHQRAIQVPTHNTPPTF